VKSRTTKRTVMVLVLLLALMALGGPLAGLAQPADGDGYPLEVDREVIVEDDVLVQEDDVPAPVEVQADEAEVLGVALARTGAGLLLLLAVGTSLGLLGGVLMALARRRRGPGVAS
jgi:hypothetical protein